MNSPVVSVVIPTYKRVGYLERAIDCVISQTYQDWELIVVDDNDEGSSYRQETETFMARYADNPRINYLKHKKNKGAPAAKNTGIVSSRGRYIAFLDDDDEWLPTKLEEQVACFARASDNVAVVYTGLRVVNVERGDVEITLPTLRGSILYHLLAQNPVGTPSSVMCKSDALGKVGLFDESLPLYEDRDLYIRLAERYEFDYVAKPLVIYNRHESERLTRDFEKSAKAYDVLYEKYKPILEKDPKAHSLFLERQGKLSVKTGNRRRAEEEYAQALRATPYSMKLLTRLLLLRLGGRHYGTVRNVGRSFQLFLKKLRA